MTGARSTAAGTAAPALVGGVCERRGAGMRKRIKGDRGARADNESLAVAVATRSKWPPSRIMVPQVMANRSNVGFSNLEIRRSPTVIARSTLAAAISAAVPCPTSFDSTSSSTGAVAGIDDPTPTRRIA